MCDEKEKTSLILHGHFYQPPRENPLTGIIPKQPSATPWNDWNEKIFYQCYEANSRSRYLTDSGRVRSLTNNYSYISFNFGPTLLHWLDEKHPETIELLREADQSSIKRLGHGNAMAQSFNHTILPLDKIDNAKLQIDWGYKDFEYHFRRAPEGMWLPECGVNEDVIQLLSEAGIKFVVLSPWQCKAVEDENGTINSLDGKPAPYWQPYILTGTKGGTVNAFFYHPGLAEGISFGHMLRSADDLYNNIKDIQTIDNKKLIHTATDGEIYGHHEPYGDMALAALIKKVEERDDFIFDNYASYLEKNPAKLHAELHKGEAGRGSSWSCSHGVSRWYKDCGCHTGGEDGWNQAWRTPLRNGLNNLSNKLEALFAEEVKKIFNGTISPLSLLSKAGCVFTGEIEMNSFISSLHKDYQFSAKDDVKLAHILSGMKIMHFAFTSCGFFFSDISGIEPRQDIKYALAAIYLFQPFCDDDLTISFLSDLRIAKSNIKTCGDGMTIAQEELKGLPGEVEAALYFHLNRTLAEPVDYIDSYGFFHLDEYKVTKDKESMLIKNTTSQEVFSFSLLLASSIDVGNDLYISEHGKDRKPKNRYRITNTDIPERIIDESLLWIDSAISRIPFNELVTMSENMRKYATLVKNSRNTSMDTLLLENLGLSLKITKSMLLGHSEKLTLERKETITNIIGFIKKYGRANDINALKHILSQYIELLSENIKKEGLTEEIANNICGFLFLSRSHGYEPETKGLQNDIYDYYSGKKKAEISAELSRQVYLALNFE